MRIVSENQQLLDAFPASAALIDQTGEVVGVNAAWKQGENIQYSLAHSIEKSDNLFEQMARKVEAGSDDALKVMLGLRGVLEGEDQFVHTYSIGADDYRNEGQNPKESTLGEAPISGKKSPVKFWYRITIRPVSKERELCLLIQEDVTKLHETSWALREIEELYYQQFERSMMAILITDQNGELVESNSHARELIGYKMDETEQLTLNQLLDQTDPHTAEVLNALADEGVYQGEATLLGKDSKEIPVEISVRTYRNESGELRNFWMLRDLVLRKRAEELFESEKRFNEAVLDSAPGVFMVTDETGKIFRSNRGYSQDLGYDPDNDAGLSIFDIVLEADHDILRSALEKIQKGEGEAIRIDLKRRDGNIRTYRFRGEPFDTGDRTYFVCAGIDITDKIQSEQQKEVTYRLLNQLFDNSPSGIVLVDRENRVEQVNRKFLEMFGFEQKELMGKDVDRFIVPKSYTQEAELILNEAIEAGPCQYESVRCRQDGSRVPVLVGAIPVRTNGEITAVYGIYSDLTAQKELEQQINNLYEKEKKARIEIEKSLQEREILIQEVHHRVKNNLAVITGLMDLQMMETDDEEVLSKLRVLQRRIFSIAQIHETIYQEENIVHVKFDEYLIKLSGFWKDQMDQNKIRLNTELQPVTLNLNQAVPAGLLVNELYGLIQKSQSCQGKEFDVRLSAEGEKVEIRFEKFEKAILKKLKETRESEKNLDMKIIDVLLLQVEAEMQVFKQEGDCPAISIRFDKTRLKGSSSSFYYE